MQALAWRNYPGRQIGRQLAGAGLGRKVALGLVVADLLVGEGVHAPSGFRLTGRPQVAQRLRWCGKALDLIGDRIAFYRLCRLRFRGAYRVRHGLVHSGVADLLELGEHLKVVAGLGQDAAGLE